MDACGLVTARPHIIGIDDSPFEKGQVQPVPIVAVMMEGADLVEGIAFTDFPVDGDAATDYLATWIAGLRFHASLQAVALGGITIAGLGIVDPTELAARLGIPVLIVTRREPVDAPLIHALETAGLRDRIPIVESSPRAVPMIEGLYLACAGIDWSGAACLARASLRKAQLPEPLRVAHLIGRALVTGESRGRV